MDNWHGRPRCYDGQWVSQVRGGQVCLDREPIRGYQAYRRQCRNACTFLPWGIHLSTVGITPFHSREYTFLQPRLIYLYPHFLHVCFSRLLSNSYTYRFCHHLIRKRGPVGGEGGKERACYKNIIFNASQPCAKVCKRENKMEITASQQNPVLNSAHFIITPSEIVIKQVFRKPKKKA